jgi:hypothetical protein
VIVHRAVAQNANARRLRLGDRRRIGGLTARVRPVDAPPHQRPRESTPRPRCRSTSEFTCVREAGQHRRPRLRRALCERRPERGAGERRLDLRQQLVDRVPVLRLLAAQLAHQPLQCVAQVPLADVQLGVGEPGADRIREPIVVVAHDPRRGAIERAEERRHVALGLGRERLQTPQFRASGFIAHRGEHPERDPEATAVYTSTQSITSDPRLMKRNCPVSASTRSRRARSRATPAASR